MKNELSEILKIAPTAAAGDNRASIAGSRKVPYRSDSKTKLIVDVIMREIPGSQQIGSGAAGAVGHSRGRRNRTCLLTGVESKLKNQKEGVGPYGLATGGNNWLENHKLSESIKFGLIDQKDIINDYKKMLIRVDGSRSPDLINDKGEIKNFPTKSRWNSEYNYSWIVGQRALDEVKGLKKVTHLILTFDPDIVEKIIPDWWFFGSEAYLAVVGGFFVSDFLRKLRTHKKKHGEPNNFITWVMEFTEKGMVHFHLLFYGSWVAKIEDLSKFWPYSQPQGIRFGKPIRHHDNGAVLASYLTRYITKSLSPIGDVDKKIKDKMELIRALLWLFKKRLYNMRHKIRNSDGEYTLGIGRDQYINPVKWSLYIPPAGNDDIVFEKEFEGYKKQYEYS